MIKPLILACHNWKVLLKSLFYQAILLALTIAIGFTLFGNTVYDLMHAFNDENLQNFASQTINAILAGDFDSLQFTDSLNNLIAELQQVISSIRFPWGGATLSYIIFVVIVALYRVLISLTDVAAMCQLDEFMTSNACRPFSWFFLKKQGRTWKFVLLQTAIALPLDILIISGGIGFYLVFLIAFRWWTIIPVCVIAYLLYIIRQTFFAFCLPAVACEPTHTGAAFRKGVAMIVGRFWQVFWKTLAVLSVAALIAVLAILFIPSPWLTTVVISVPHFVLFFYLKCINIVEYFKAENRPFFYKRVDVEGTERYIRKMDKQSKAGQTR